LAVFFPGYVITRTAKTEITRERETAARHPETLAVKNILEDLLTTDSQQSLRLTLHQASSRGPGGVTLKHSPAYKSFA
jgi:hypothetical protein